jgi:hypothetical protein
MQDIKPMLELWATTPGIQIGLGDDEDSIKAFLGIGFNNLPNNKGRGFIGRDSCSHL